VAAPVAAAIPRAQPLPAAAPPAAVPIAPAIDIGPGPCKSHPKTAGRYYCHHCRHHFCDLCVTSRPVGGAQHKFCRHCGSECVVVQIQAQAYHASGGKNFFARLPGAFVYPFRGAGIFVLVLVAFVFSFLQMFGGGISVMPLMGLALGGVKGAVAFSLWAIIGQVFLLGYMFSYMQSVIHTTAVEDPEMPSLPSVGNFWQDILLPCLEFLGLVVISFGPVAACIFFMVSGDEPRTSLGPLLLGLFALGCIYFPMAFLSVAMLDSIFAANPLQVIPAIFKAPLEYLTTLVMLACLIAFHTLGQSLLPQLFPKGLSTHNMVKLFGYLATSAIWSVFSLYLLTVAMHILGLLYVSKKQKLAWLEH
jgi:hypothetical protein